MKIKNHKEHDEVFNNMAASGLLQTYRGRYVLEKSGDPRKRIIRDNEEAMLDNLLDEVKDKCVMEREKEKEWIRKYNINSIQQQSKEREDDKKFRADFIKKQMI